MVKINIKGYVLETTVDELIELFDKLDAKEEKKQAVIHLFKEGRKDAVEFTGLTQIVKKKVGRPKGSKTNKRAVRMRWIYNKMNTLVKKGMTRKRAYKIACRQYDRR